MPPSSDSTGRHGIRRVPGNRARQVGGLPEERGLVAQGRQLEPLLREQLAVCPHRLRREIGLTAGDLQAVTGELFHVALARRCARAGFCSTCAITSAAASANENLVVI